MSDRSDADRIDAVRILLEQAKDAHGRYEATELGGVYDRDWPRWYAAWAAEHGVADLLGRTVTTERLADLLASTNSDLEGLEPAASEPWAAYTARRIVTDL